MRLNSIKLSGFKSFVEPTQFQLPGQLVGVVGPNGCGKSNVIDAVRWVLGESKASELRGESMQDVIFNGSSLRKPAGRASVELTFDNGDGRAGGPWGRFAEIAVKRVLTRDGTSSYHINGQPVRRRDVQDVFLGTGLGPRAYAIIGQGTISRIIESKPEELRLFLEEAAGVSKYKERRRETEGRLRDTRENLTRVEDILRELNQNLEKLESQAEVAGRYRSLQQEAQQKQHQLWFLRHRDAAREEERVRQAAIAAVLALEAESAALRQAEAELESIRQAHYAANDALHAAQGVLGHAALEVSRLEERIRYIAEQRARIARQRADLEVQSAAWRTRASEAGDERERLAAQIAAAEQAASDLTAQIEAQGAVVASAEERLRKAEGESGQQRSVVATAQQHIQVAAAEGRGIDERLAEASARRDRLLAEEKGLADVDLSGIEAARRSVAEADARVLAAQAEVARWQERIPGLEDERRLRQASRDSEGRRHADLSARLAALQALQEKVQVEDKVKPWLARHGLETLAGLWTRVRIEPGWEAALESALRERLSALEVGRLDTVRAFAADAPPARLAFFTATAAPAARTQRSLPRLADLLHLGDSSLAALLGDWLEGVYTADDFDSALAARSTLAHGEIIMTREGHSVSQFAVSFYAPDSEQAGLLARAQEIENLERQTRAQAHIADDARVQLGRAEAASVEAAAQLAAAQRDAARQQSLGHQQHVELLRLEQLEAQTRQRRDQLGEERGGLDAELAELTARRSASEARFESLDGELAVAQERHAELDDLVLAARRTLEAERVALRDLERRLQEARFELRAAGARGSELERAIDTARQQLEANRVADAALADEHSRLADASADEELQAALATKLERERALGERRSQYDDLAQRLRAADEKRLGHEQALVPLRDRVIALQLEEQAAKLGGAQYLEQLEQAGADRAAVARSVEEQGVKLAGLQGRIDALNRDIEALGAVNLAALEELTSARERKGFLDAQNGDLREAMSTLEDAIRKIDLETRELLGTTFDQVNDHFGRMFPTLFGGGNARLVMTGDEILDAGVQVMAQPPGKKNSSIHLLSGGEKALTAIALVFAIFQLNPAPFCLLDEVDAPLDDANTERYAKLVNEMAKSTQFLFISHNRIAMEMAEQLIGVTMQEQGVSRIVTVDMPGAIRLAEAA
ncbi:MAG TPA: chromosome segregation protein SMC [Caldimonas sp.]|nr:chromosome segregation protein SMC [Caldimonas sp.]HEX2540547.1 chromosome segregation protein SMC [Caldimonas sp.]